MWYHKNYSDMLSCDTIDKTAEREKKLQTLSAHLRHVAHELLLCNIMKS
jgi:hypothetical protein